MLGGAIVLIIVGVVLGIFFPLLFIVTGVGIALLVVALAQSARGRRADAGARRVP